MLNRTPNGRNRITRRPAESVQTRSAIVGEREQSIQLTRRGISSSTFDSILSQPDQAIVAYIGTETAVLFPTATTAGKAAAAANRLDRLGRPVRIVTEQMDPGRSDGR